MPVGTEVSEAIVVSESKLVLPAFTETTIKKQSHKDIALLLTESYVITLTGRRNGSKYSYKIGTPHFEDPRATIIANDHTVKVTVDSDDPLFPSSAKRTLDPKKFFPLSRKLDGTFTLDNRVVQLSSIEYTKRVLQLP